MKRVSQPGHPPSSPEDGYMLVAVIFMLAIVLLTLAVAVPRVREDLQRERDLETMHRGQQYIRAIQLYYRKFGSYPPNIDALVKTNEIRFLRKRYIDPITGKDDWKPIPVGQNKTPIMGFFGQPLAGAGSPIGGVGPGGVAGATPASGAFGSTDTSGSSFGASGIGASGTTSGSAGGATTGLSGGSGFSLGSGIGSSGSSATAGATTPGGTASPTGSAAPGGQTFGGLGLMGVSLASPKQSVYVYKKKNHYNEWEFLYSPLMDQQTQGNTGAIGQPAAGLAGGTGTSMTGSPTGGGFSLGSGFGSSTPGTGPTGSGTPTNPTPQPTPTP